MAFCAALLKRVCPQASDAIVSALAGHDDVFSKRAMTSPLEQQEFLAQVCVETWHLTRWQEDLTSMPRNSGSRA